MLIDSHCHLDFPDFATERDDVIARARSAGVVRMVTICTRLDRLPATLDLADRYDDVWAAAGTHPHEAGTPEGRAVTVDRLVDLAADPRIVGIGETGLDYFYDHSPRDAQEESFRRHMAAARRTGLPMIVHTRDADPDTVRLLAEGREGGSDGPLRGVIHCFSSGRDLAEKAVEMGFYVSLSGILTFKRSDEIRSIVADLPLDRLLVETDAPYLAPVPKRGKRNEPAFVAHTARVLGDIKGLTADDVARRTTENFFTLFDKVPAPVSA